MRSIPYSQWRLNLSTNLCSHTVKERANAVCALVRQSVAAWLEVAKHVRAAKSELTEGDFANFIELTGLTKAICDKLLRIAQCDKLYDTELNKHSSRLEGWTNLYELSKLNNPELDQFVSELDKDQTVAVTREFIRSFRASSQKPSAQSKQSVVAKVMFSHDDVARLDLIEFEKLKALLDEIGRLIDAASPAISIKVIDSVVLNFEALLSTDEASDDEQLDCTAEFSFTSAHSTYAEVHSQSLAF